MAPKKSQWARLEALEHRLKPDVLEILNPRTWDAPTMDDLRKRDASITAARGCGQKIIVIPQLQGNLDRLGNA